MLPQQVIYRQIRPQSPQRRGNQILRHSVVVPYQFATPLRDQRSQSFAHESTIKKQQQQLASENQVLKEKIVIVNEQIRELQKNNDPQAQEEFFVALKIQEELKLQIEEIRLEINYIKKENQVLTKQLKDQHY